MRPYTGCVPEPLIPSVGRAVVHLFCRPTAATDRAALAAAIEAAAGDDVSTVSVATLGHKADLCLMLLGPDLWALRRAQTALLATGLELVDSYVSLTEVSEYAEGVPEAMRQARLYPVLPPEGLRAWCFYPMSKRRGEHDNWFLLPFEERMELMLEHGATGRTFRGRVLQLITGSTGIDDFEWGVTLFAANPDDLKAAVYTMRYDRASARFGDFGPFFTGMVGSLDEVLDAVGVA